ncbi:MAG: 50S ribosomal protein L25/general stress protein Ctc [Hormoscilla sp.]
MEIKVECQKREQGSKPRAMRRAGLIPANLYGHNGAEAISLTLPAKTVEHLLKEATVNNTLIDLEITDIPWRGKTLLREVQTHPWKGYPYHLSFFSIASQSSIKVVMPLKFVGEAIGVKQQGGILETRSTEIEVECAPDNIPEAIEVDVSELQVGKALHVKELVLPPGVKAASEPEQILATVLASRLTKTQKDTE